MYGDRICENINRLQDERNGKFASFDKALHYSDEVIALMHVRQAWEAAKFGETRLHDPLKQSTLNAAEVIRQKLRAELGTDLTIATDHNPFFHTGNPVKLNAGPRRSYRPWADYWDVAAGRSAGKDRVAREKHDDYIRRVIDEQLFPY